MLSLVGRFTLMHFHERLAPLLHNNYSSLLLFPCRNTTFLLKDHCFVFQEIKSLWMIRVVFEMQHEGVDTTKTLSLHLFVRVVQRSDFLSYHLSRESLTGVSESESSFQ